MKRILIILLVALLVGCASGKAAESTTPPIASSEELMYGDITGEQLVVFVENPDVTIIDVRTPEEYADGHVEGAINIPVDRFQREFDQLALDPDQALAIYCRSGNRSGVVYRILVDEGFEKIYHAPGVSQFDYPLVK